MFIVSALVLTRVDYCNSAVLTVLPAARLRPLRRVMNSGCKTSARPWVLQPCDGCLEATALAAGRTLHHSSASHTCWYLAINIRAPSQLTILLITVRQQFLASVSSAILLFSIANSKLFYFAKLSAEGSISSIYQWFCGFERFLMDISESLHS